MKDVDISFTQNRELSWLRFNERVLEEAQDIQVPLLEKVKFMSIFDSNLDEFFMVRVGSLTDLSMLNKRVIDNKSLMDQEEQLRAIFERTRELYQKKDHIYAELSDQFRARGFNDVEMEEVSDQEEVFLKRHFENNVSPYLNYQVVDITHPFPHIPNLGIVIVYALKKEGSDAIDRIGVIQLPENVTRYVKLDNNKYILIEKVIRKYGRELFDTYDVGEAYTMRVTRNADIDWDDEEYEFGDDYRAHMKKMLKKRKRLMPVRLEIDKLPEEIIKNFLLKNLSLSEERLFITKSPMRMDYFFSLSEELEELMGEKHAYAPFTPQRSRYIDPDRPVIEQVEDHDILLSYPYESMDPMIDLLKEAAEDASVISIKITLYRIAKDSKVAEQLIAAAENGKDVIVLLELRARFDEENNIMWSSYLERAGCRVIYGFNKYKCHSKVLLITRMKDEKPNYIAQVATGNYNEKTAKLYTDFALITNNQRIGKDANHLFDNIMIGELGGDYDVLLVSPKSLPEGVSNLIDEQIERAQAGEDAYVRLKMNSISDRIIIDKLSEASNAGVKVDMLVRGITCIVPRISGKTENIAIYSLVGRFLEHHRVYQFGRGMDSKVYISSADFMTRNLRRRVEVACPILDPKIKQRVLDFMDTMFKDDVKRRELLPSRRYAYVENKENFIAQDALMEEAIRFARRDEISHEKKSHGAKKIKESRNVSKPKREGFFKRLWNKLFG